MSQSSIVLQNGEVTQNEWLSMDPMIKNMALEIAISIKETHEKIEKAKQIAENAPNIKGGFFGIGKQRKINDALSKSQIGTNDAVSDLSDLIQKSIKLTMQSVKTASNIQKALAYLSVNGIRDANGNIEKLSIECTESINTIIDSASDFIEQQAKIEESQNAIIQKTNNHEERISNVEISLKELIEFKERYKYDISKLKLKLRISLIVIAIISVLSILMSIISFK